MQPIHSSHKSISEERYFEMFGCLPPIYVYTIDGKKADQAFAVSEPYTQDRDTLVFNVYYKAGDAFYETKALVWTGERKALDDSYEHQYGRGYIAETWSEKVFIPNQANLRAFKANGFPSNPLPFLNDLSSGVRKNGTEWIRSDEAKALMQVLNGQVHGQMYKIDSVEEFNRLNAIFQ